MGCRLDNTLLEELPALLGKLVKLRGFSAVQNKLVSLPEEFGKIPSAEWASDHLAVGCTLGVPRD